MKEKNNRQRGREKTTVADQLESLRENIDTVDREIVSLIAKRQKEIEKVVSLKKAHNLPLYHPAREEDLISDRRSRARDSELNPDFIEEVFRCIIRQSRIKQAAHLASKAIRPGAVVLIVGGSGGMGRYFDRYFSEAGYEVRKMGSAHWDRVEALCDGIDVAMVSVPIAVTESVIERLGPHLPEHCILTDLTSIKVRPLEAMLKAHGGPVVGLHPLFGPSTSTLDKQIVVVTPGRDFDRCSWIVEQFSSWGAVIVRASAEEHDEIMGVVQTLRHFATFAFGQFLTRRKVDIRRTLEFSSPIYRLELGMVGRLFAQDPALYSEIIFASPERLALLKEYLRSMAENLEMIENRDKHSFEEEFKKISEWFGPFSEQALRESGFIIDKLIERF